MAEPALIPHDHSHHGITLKALLEQVQATVRRVSKEQWVRAELARVGSKDGHLWLELVDHDENGEPSAHAKAVIWSRYAKAIQERFQNGTGGQPEAGIKILVLVSRMDFHPKHGLRLFVTDIDPSYTLGDIEARLRQIREALSKEGILEWNKRLPSSAEFCQVAVISPENAAGLRDCMNQRIFMNNWVGNSSAFKGSDNRSSCLACSDEDWSKSKR